MPAVRTAETRTITLAVTDVPDLPADLNPSIAPISVEITYSLRHPAHREGSWYKLGRTHVKVTGLRRLKSGSLGQQEITRDLWQSAGRPGWVNDLVAAHIPEGWNL
ncbi:hypothetical protein ACIQGZ_17235 [Streptomyces sp. NPDC092296]|uniref:hypothetical protein n=1 Tax=Streptomyces sp. NPDC092296 TaxID=3366012 RepID=UPI0038115EAA